MRKIKRIVALVLILTTAFSGLPSVSECILKFDKPSDPIDLPYTLTDTIPEEYGDYFEKLLKNPYSDETPPVTYDTYLLGNTIGTSMCMPNLLFTAWIIRLDSKYAKATSSNLIAAVREKDSENILALELIITHREIHKLYNEYLYDINLKLPDYFDTEKHELVLFFYHVARYGTHSHIDESFKLTDETTQFIYTSFIIDVEKYIYGDANKDGKVNLTDITLMLKYMAGWNTVTIDTSLLNKEHSRHSYDPSNCWYNMIDMSYVLKSIAGWDKNTLAEERLKEGRALSPDSDCIAYYIENNQ
ncbi:MAG: hypothetical protein IKW08_05785 [Roseburia sp.]|nr:hypothetical protein [Roseburia sp.]